MLDSAGNATAGINAGAPCKTDINEFETTMIAADGRQFGSARHTNNTFQ